MEVYHKISTPFLRDMDGNKKLIRGEWAKPELEYLKDNEWKFTEKVDGTNIRVGIHNNGIQFGGRSDRAVMSKPLVEHLASTFILDKMLEHFDIGNSTTVTLFGEGVGEKIQHSGRYGLGYNFILFDVLLDSPDGKWWLRRDDVNDVADKLGIYSVPVLGEGTLQDAIDIVSTGVTFNAGGGIVRWGNGGLKSAWGDFEAEGIIAEPVTPLFNRKGERIICKIKSVDFK